jgi:hypothetical protein
MLLTGISKTLSLAFYLLCSDCNSSSWNPNTATYWLAPTRTAALIVLNLGCTQVIEGLTPKNTKNAHENNRGPL